MTLKNWKKFGKLLGGGLIALIFPLHLFAQQIIRPSFSLEYLLPIRKTDNFGLGPMLNIEWKPENEIWGIRFTTGAAFSPTTDEYKRSLGYVPLKLSLQIRLLPRLYGLAGGGPAFGFNGYGNHFIGDLGVDYRFARHWSVAISYQKVDATFVVPRMTYSF